jgi:hypothetical protein
MIEGSERTGSVRRTNGSIQTGRLKNLRILRIRIRNTALSLRKIQLYFCVVDFMGCIPTQRVYILEFHLKAYHQEEIFSGSGLKIHQPEKDESSVVGSEW